MKTTIELPDQLVKQVKVQSAKSGLSMKDYFIRALKKELSNTIDIKEKPWLELKNMADLSNLTPEINAFDDYIIPGDAAYLDVNEPNSNDS